MTEKRNRYQGLQCCLAAFMMFLVAVQIYRIFRNLYQK
jgi:hypothetical protein